MTTEKLGIGRARVNGVPADVNVFVFWLPDPKDSLARMVPTSVPCPHCRRIVDLRVFRENTYFQSPDIFSTALQCKECGSVLHFDKTAEATRERLTWTKRFRKE